MPKLYPVEIIGEGVLTVMPMPSPEMLHQDVTDYSEEGITCVLSLLETEEECFLGLSEEKKAVEDHGMRFMSHPIRDGGIPELAEFTALIDLLHNRLTASEHLAIHCRAGIGRTGLTASCILIKAGYTAVDAIDLVTSKRGTPVPETQEQYDFINDFYEAAQKPV